MSDVRTYVIEGTKDGEAVHWRQTASVGLAWAIIQDYLDEGCVVRVEMIGG